MYKKFFDLGARKFHFPKKEIFLLFFLGGMFFIFSSMDQVAPYYTTALASVTHERGPNLTMEG